MPLQPGKDHPDYDPELNAIVQKDAHLSVENQASNIQKEYHTYNVEALENDVKRIDNNIALFNQHIAAEEERKEELFALITEGKERDHKLLELVR